MALKITKASDPITVDRLNVVIYAAPGVGKTSLAFTASRPLLFDFDHGSHRAANRKDTVIVNEWSDAATVTADDLEPFNTVIVDTAGRALDILTANLMKNTKNTTRDGSALSLQGYGALKREFVSFLGRLNSYGKDVVLIAHMDEQRNGDEVVERLDVTGGSKNEIYKTADAMGRITFRGDKRFLLFSPTDASFGKNPGQLDPVHIPPINSAEYGDTLARVIADTKAAMNALTEAQKEALAEQEWFRETLPTVTDPEGVNALIDRAKAGGRAVQSMLNARAKELGFAFDPTQGGYVVPSTKGEAA